MVPLTRISPSFAPAVSLFSWVCERAQILGVESLEQAVSSGCDEINLVSNQWVSLKTQTDIREVALLEHIVDVESNVLIIEHTQLKGLVIIHDSSTFS